MIPTGVPIKKGINNNFYNKGRVISEKTPLFPPEHRPVIIEKWLPYRLVKRPVIYQRAPDLPLPKQERNTIITWTTPQVEVVRNIRNLGVVRADPVHYASKYGTTLSDSQYVLDILSHYGINTSEMRNKSAQVYIEDTDEIDRLLNTDFHSGYVSSANALGYAARDDYYVKPISTGGRLYNGYGTADAMRIYDTVPHYGNGARTYSRYYKRPKRVDSCARQSALVNGGGGQRTYQYSATSDLSRGGEYYNAPGYCAETCVYV